MAAKRTTESSSKRPGSPIQTVETSKKACRLWGSLREHLNPVKITCIRSSRKRLSVDDFRNVSYTQYKEAKPIEATIHSFEDIDLISQNYEESMIGKLQPLEDELQPLAKMKLKMEGRKSRGAWDIAAEDLPKTRLCFTIVKAFLFEGKAEGKAAMNHLLSEVVSRLKLSKDVQVVSTGSASHVSSFATSYQMDIMMDETSSTSDEQLQSSPEYKENLKSSKEVTFSTPTSRPEVRKTSPQSATGSPESSTDSSKCHNAKLSTSDVLVFTQESLDKPIVSKLVVSIKRGTDEDVTDIVKELLSRLPYQAGVIYGLQINARQATLCSVQFEDQSEDSLPIVVVFIYRHYIFKGYGKPFATFDVESFWRMVLDIGYILQS